MSVNGEQVGQVATLQVESIRKRLPPKPPKNHLLPNASCRRSVQSIKDIIDIHNQAQTQKDQTANSSATFQ